MRRSRVMLVLLSTLVCSRISAELADDFNIPKGWRMQVSATVVVAFLNGQFGYSSLLEYECTAEKVVGADCIQIKPTVQQHSSAQLAIIVRASAP